MLSQSINLFIGLIETGSIGTGVAFVSGEEFYVMKSSSWFKLRPYSC